MRRILAALGMISAAILVLAIMGVSYVFFRTGRLDHEATSFSVDAVGAITGHWDGAALRARAAPDLEKSLEGDQATRIFTWFATLGGLQDKPVCEGNAAVYAGTGGSRTTARVTCNAHYKAGPATIQLALIKKGGTWSILGFHVDSPMLLPQQPSQRS